MTFYQKLLTELKEKKLSEKELTKLKRDLSLKYRLLKIPSNIEILMNIPEDKILELKKRLLTKPVRTISGVAPVAIMTKPFPCPHARKGGPCIMCPGGPGSEFGDVPQSYTGKEPAAMRGIRNKYDAYLQVFNRLEQYVLLGHNCEKVELILMGGTFPSFPLEYQEEFVKYAFKAMNDFSVLFYNERGFDYLKFKQFFRLPVKNIGDRERMLEIHQKLLELKGECSLEQEQVKNETAKIRCTALCIETRPDHGLLEQGNQMLKLGATRVELGIQSVYDPVLERIKRGHTTKDTIKSIQILKDLGFKVAAHYMPGLPGIDKEQDLAGMKELFSNPHYQPDMLKIYPCLVTKGTKLFQEWQEGKFKPLNAREAAELIVEFKKQIPEYCRVMRVQRDIPTSQIAAGVEMTNLRQYLKQNYDLNCRCIRCREPKNKPIKKDNVEIKVIKYEASQGKEYFISAEDREHDVLAGFCRLRFPSQALRKEIDQNSALIRELHVYGAAVGIGSEGEIQHQGYGKRLMQKAEEIAQKNSKTKIVIISGAGVREYYRKLGYILEGPYMVKTLAKVCDH